MTGRAILTAVAVLASAAAPCSVRLYVNVQGKRVGLAVANQKILPDGSKVVQLSLQIAAPGGNSVTLRSESTYNGKGAPVRMFHESVTSNPKTRRTVTVSFSKTGATATEEVGGKRDVNDVPLAPGAPLESKSEFWFIRDMPKPGAVDKRYRFDVSSLKWELATSTYIGKKTIKIGTKTFAAHEVRSTRGTAFVDDAGMPIRLEMDQITLERVPTP